MKPKAVKKIQGTYRSCRDKDTVEEVISEVAKPVTGKIIIQSVRKDVQNYFDKHIALLESMGLVHEIDLPQLTIMYKILNDIINIDADIENETDNKKKSDLYKTKARMITAYNDIAKLYYVSPFSRSKATLDSLTIQQIKQKNASNLEILLSKKRA